MNYLIQRADGAILLRARDPIRNPYGPAAFIVQSTQVFQPSRHFYNIERQAFAERSDTAIQVSRREAKENAADLSALIARFVELWGSQDAALRELIVILLSVPADELLVAVSKHLEAKNGAGAPGQEPPLTDEKPEV